MNPVGVPPAPGPQPLWPESNDSDLSADWARGRFAGSSDGARSGFTFADSVRESLAPPPSLQNFKRLYGTNYWALEHYLTVYDGSPYDQVTPIYF